MQSWFYRGLELVQDALHGLGADVTEPARAGAAHAVVDRLAAASPAAGQRGCGAGCASCCHYPVGVTEAEVAALVAHLHERLDARTLAALRSRVDARARAVESTSWAAQAAAGSACVLLGDDDRCAAYDARPVACRALHSRSRLVCEQLLAGAAVAPALDAHAWVAGLGVHAGLARESGDGQTYELTSALHRGLCAADASAPIDLAGCKRADP